MSEVGQSSTGTSVALPDMSATFALKSSLRKSMLRTLRGSPMPSWSSSVGQLEKLGVEKSADPPVILTMTDVARAVFKILLDQPFFKRAKTVGCYLNMAKGELRTNQIVDHLLRRGSALYTPYIPAPPTNTHNPEAPSRMSPPPDHDMRMLRLYSSEDLKNCPLDKWGIIDPGTFRKDVDKALREDCMNPKSPALDVILIPGVAFDEECNRLGRGKAYYDRFLLSYTLTRPPPLLVAIALEPQILPSGERVPTTDTDFQLDGVISPYGITWRKDVGAKVKDL